jgi:hypothetical protein
MNTVKVDSAHRVRLMSLNPGDIYEPQVGQDTIILRRVPPPRRKWTYDEVVQAIKTSKLRFEHSWEDMRAETREP